MRFAFVAFAFVCSFSLVAAQTASIDPTPAPPVPAVTKVAPPPTSVNVLNWPETQAVAGIVSVDNLPAVQTVGGTVNVGNLPLDADGAVRVTSAPTRQPILQELLTETVWIAPGTTYFTTEVDTSGYSRVGVRYDGDSVSGSIQWHWDGDPSDSFDLVANSQDGVGVSSCEEFSAGMRVICAVSGDRIRLAVQNRNATPYPLYRARVYLFP